jgi:inhibitor of KinA sporulation pathway (predicted exonuclease)
MKIQFLDCEMLCWNQEEVPSNQSKHIIQIGIVETDTEKLEITRKKSFYIRPQNKDFEVSDYCVHLTGITHSKVIDEGHYFPEVMRTIAKEFSPNNKITYAWGSDYEPLAKHCSDYGCKNPWAENGIWDFGIIFRSAYNIANKIHLENALNYLGLTFPLPKHNALNDAHALAMLHNKMMSTIRLGKENKS